MGLLGLREGLVKVTVDGVTKPYYGIERCDSDRAGYHQIGKSRQRDQGILFDVYDFGFPIRVFVGSVKENSFFSEGPAINKSEEVKTDEYLEHLEVEGGALVGKSSIGGLAAACFLTRARYVKEVIKNIKRDNIKLQHFAIAPSSSRTGIYVICSATSCCLSDRNDLDPSKTDLEAIRVNPRIHPSNLALVIQQFYPEQFGNVSSSQAKSGGGMLWGGERGSILNRGYFAYEISEEGLKFIDNPRELSLR